MLFIVPARVVPGYGQLEEGKVLRSGDCGNTRGDAGASACSEFVSEIIQNVSVGRCRVGKHFVRKDFCIDRHKGKIKAQAAGRFRECCAIQELFTSHVVGANMDEGGSQALAVEQAMKYCSGFSIVGGRHAEGAASAVCNAPMEENISPSSRACRRMLINDSRTVSDKHSMKGVWKRMGERCRKIKSGF